MEVAGGAVAFEAATTVLEGGAAAGVALAQSTQPLHGTFTRFAVAPGGDGRYVHYQSSTRSKSGHAVDLLPRLSFYREFDGDD
jgi:hypothetical protein